MTTTQSTRRVYTFRTRFVPLIDAKVKLHTMRRAGKRPPPKVGTLLDLRYWSDRPYNSPQVKIGTAVCSKVETCVIVALDNRVCLDGKLLTVAERDAFALRDGFKDWADMRFFFLEMHGTGTVAGNLIHWNPATYTSAEPLHA